MDFVVVTSAMAVVAALVLVLFAPRYLAAAADHDLSGPQKLHSRPVPRIGGVAVALGLLIGALWVQFTHPDQAAQVWWLLACALPTTLAGLWEDFTKSVSPGRRLVASAVSALMAVFLMGAVITRSGVPGFDTALAYFPVAVAFTVVAIAGTSNAINIIDGLNGLASMCVVIMLAGLAFVAWQVGDRFVFAMALMVIGATLGFFVLNYPAGLIFLGDGGAYLLGFLLSTLGILVFVRNPEVSPLFPLVLFAYPVVETVFSMYRRKVVRGRAASAPDGAHLHSLIYRRVIRSVLCEYHPPARRKTARNAMASPYLWVVSLSSVVPAVIFWNHTFALSITFFVFCGLYVGAYVTIVRFQVPRFLVLRRTLQALARHPMRGQGAAAARPVDGPLKVTVITVCGGDARRLAQTLASVASQTHARIEHIVVDRGTSGDTPELVRACPPGRVRLVPCRARSRHEAMNRGLAAATGDLIGFLDAGDVFAGPDAVATLAAAAAASRSDVVYADLGYLRQGPLARLMGPWRPGPFSRTALRLGWMPPHATFYVKRRLLGLVGRFDRHLRLAAEYEFILRCFAIEARRPAYVPQVLVRTMAAGQPLWPVWPALRKAHEDLQALRRTRLGGLLTVGLKLMRRGWRFLWRLAGYLARQSVDTDLPARLARDTQRVLRGVADRRALAAAASLRPPKVTVITVCFNSAATIGDTLASVRSQRYPDIEHIVIDGASTDATADIVRREGGHVARFVSEPDQGIYDAMNKGLRLASGDLIGFLNADDVFAGPDTVQQIVDAAQHSRADIVYGDLVYVRPDDTDTVVRHWRSGGFNRRSLATGWMPPHPTLYLARRLVQATGPFDTTLRIAADYDYILRAFARRQSAPAYVPQVLVRMRNGGASNKSLGALWVKSREDLLAMRRSRTGHIGTLLMKNARKVPQFFLGARLDKRTPNRVVQT